MCSIGVKSRLYGGHASGAMLLFARNSGNMWSGIVLLQNQITLLHKRDCNRTQDLIPIPYCGHIARNNNQLWFYPVSNASLDHNGATPNRSRSTTQASAKRSPRRRYTRRRPSARQQRQQEGGTPDIDFQFDFDFKIWGVATNELQQLETCWSQTNEIWKFCSIHVPFCNHSKIFNKLFQTWMKFRNKIYPAFLFPFSISQTSFKLQIGHEYMTQIIIYHLQRTTVMFFVFCTLSLSGIHFCKVSWKYLKRFLSYGADTILWPKSQFTMFKGP